MANKKALLVPFHFPPIKASSGLERSLAMVRHLPSHGWEPLVLSASASAYPTISAERVDQIPSGTVIKRALALDASRHLAILGRYPRWFALPDRWQTWILSAVPMGMAMIHNHRPKVIWSTYPISSAHWVGYLLHRLSGIPWIADFRDPMVERNIRSGETVPAWPALRAARLAIESRAAAHSAALTFCTESALQICAQRYPKSESSRWRVVPNGFDESTFLEAERSKGEKLATGAGEIVLLHSGTIYPTPDRDPSIFFRALRRVLDNRAAGSRRVKVVLRASGIGNYYGDLIAQLNLQGIVEFAPALPYEAALREMMSADGLLIFQGYTSNPAIPAKLYEYFRAGRPILALADSDGETAQLIREEAAGAIAALDDEDSIVAGLGKFLRDVELGEPTIMRPERVALFERANGVGRFANLFDMVAG
jgi:glycosyltransferase involved in cell wall biosynthesis